MDVLKFVQGRNPGRKVQRVEMIPNSRAYKVFFSDGGMGYGGLPSEASSASDADALRQYMEEAKITAPREYMEELRVPEGSVLSEEELEMANPYMKYLKELQGE
jgi:hypothetical protein